MSQKAMEAFFLPRKRRNPCSKEDQNQKRSGAKRFKLDSAASSAGVSTQVKYHENKDTVLTALGAHAKGKVDAKGEVAKQRLPSSTAPDTSGLAGPSREATSSETNKAQCVREESLHQGLLSPKAVQRRLFADDNDAEGKPAPREQVQKMAPSSKVTAGMSPQKMKDSLKSCNKIDQLKEKLACFNRASLQLKEFDGKMQRVGLKGQSTASKAPLEFVVSSPVKTPKKCALSPEKTPAYERFQHLLRDAPSTLTLPYKFRFLKEAFHCLDTVSSFLHNRKEIITFKKLKASVQEMLSKNFTEAQLAQIKTVFPFAYIFRREKNLPNHKVTPDNKDKWQLTIEVNTNFESDMKMSAAGFGEKPPAHSEYRKLLPSMLIERSRIFHASLLDIMLQHHNEFLQSLEPPVSVEASLITRWHPDFQLEAVPDVVAAPLPAPPADEVGGTARQVLERARTLFSRYPHLQQCLESVAGAEPVPEAATFVTERRAALPLEATVARLADSSRSVPDPDELMRHVELMAQEAPAFLQVMRLKSGTFLKINRDMDVNVVVKELERKAQKA
ncbi:DNA replication factor Cdt1-like [Pollicipes pollicipes]|uniref:DNA replication factor Cdt1-like n=1 Tax=Pollicipes pollicipes TaxID=41117 RepID=UPI0018859C65|nr:DNA replication factor Cdt1-like [Pollicipes pollicipes]